MNYSMALTNLADSYWDAAYNCEIKVVWERALFHNLELLRLDAWCADVIRIRVPFILLYLNREDDAYAFTRYWLMIEDLNYDQILAPHRRSREGDWIYPIEPNCHYLDIRKECPKLEEVKSIVPYLVVLAIIKLRIVASHDATVRAVDFVRMLDRNDIPSQRQQVHQLFARIQHDEPCLLSTMLELGDQFQSHESTKMKDLTENYPYPINITLWYGLRVFVRVPGAVEILRLCVSK